MSLKLKSFKKAISTSGVPERLISTSTKTHSAIITANPSNSGTIYIGDSNVSASSENGTPLQANETLELTATNIQGTSELLDLSQYFADVSSNGDGVLVSYLSREQFALTPFTNDKSVVFDGVDEYIDIASDDSLDITDSLTVSLWMKAPDATGTVQGVASRGRLDTGDAVWRLLNAAGVDDNKLRVFLSADGTDGTVKEYDTSIDMFDNNWHHFAFTFSSNTLKLYVDGSEDTGVTKTTDDTVNTLFSTSTNSQISSVIDNLGNRIGFFNGNIDEFAIFDKVLSDTQISEIYNSGSPANLDLHSARPNLVTWLRLGDDENFPTIPDKVGVNDGTMINMELVDIESDTP